MTARSPTARSHPIGLQTTPTSFQAPPIRHALALVPLVHGVVFLISAAAMATLERRPLQYHVDEEQPMGTLVTSDLSRDAGMTSRYAPSVLRTLSYVLLAQQQLLQPAGKPSQQGGKSVALKSSPF